MKLEILSLLFFILLFAGKSSAQNSEKTFDFWVGEWDAYWSDSLKGSNSIVKILNDKVIQENFSENNQSFIGKSWTLYDSANSIWRQTWVDNNGAYLTFTGGQEADGVALYTEKKMNKTGESYYMRMIFQNIEENTFDWNWQRSPDKINWNTVWAIKYQRK